MTWLVAYDIADPCRLRRVARYLERRALRVQKSVFVARATSTELRAWFDELRPLLRLDADVLQAWRLSESPDAESVRLGPETGLGAAAFVCDGAETHAVRTT